MGIYRFKPWKDRQLLGVAAWLIQCRIDANGITLFGLICGLIASVLLWRGLYGASLIFLLTSVFSDVLDGTVARLQGVKTLFGKILDATTDRLVEIAWVAALIASNRLPWWGVLLPIGSVLLFYCRYHAFRHGQDTSYVVFTRFERIVVMVGTLISPWPWVTNALYLGVVIGTFASAVQILSFNKTKDQIVPVC